jgi:hypothetical protein
LRGCPLDICDNTTQAAAAIGGKLENLETQHRAHIDYPCRQPDPAAGADRIFARPAGRSVDEAAFAACLAKSVADIVRRQAEAGIDVVSDGEFGKTISWSQYALERLSGFERRASGSLRRQTPEVGAECPNRARSDLCGGRSVMGVPTAIFDLQSENSSL